jgi:phage-related holin
MKTIPLLALTFTTSVTFICTYFYNLTLENFEQYLALIAVVMLDGFFGVLAGIKREGFQTFKAIKVLRTVIVWIMFLSVLLLVEKAFAGTAWLSETILVPFMVFQLISALKNASMAGFIKATVLNRILDALDNHKGGRIE